MDNHRVFPRVLTSNAPKINSPTINAAMNHEALPLRICNAIFIQSTGSCLINAFGIAINVVKMKQGIINDLTMVFIFFLKSNIP